MKLYIKELREQREMTQIELAERMQVSFQTISKWENEVNLPDITHQNLEFQVFWPRNTSGLQEVMLTLGGAGAQIDLLIERRDRIINICEIKFSFYDLRKYE